ncbi:hypothetical protein Poli38472_000443 [Pythium oligandrum]|uniref:Major facilitator superfamily (MFS) profile domain-containing protein n=1 Tax=Pythium oligandrum TaxID=41045 RepID=A0A8K1CCH6_PYTOL|nr:hypothetical protein Poli38472_000443 [Pythium oligandrum]|eukprot:TMW60401.1 hypothetical protein Poli38472_000443 [Pythium oligandrum]
MPRTRASGSSSGKTAVFLLTFFSYVMFHACRKSFSAIKGQMSDEQWIHSALYPKEQQAQMYGLLDTLFMAFYAVGLYISGVLGDNYDLRRIIAGGMWLTGVIVLMFGLGAFADIHSLGFYATLWALNGLVQSCGWPANVAVMGKWFSQRERGAVLGIWSGNACFGNIVGTALVALTFELVDKTVAWKLAMVVAAALIILHGVVIHFFLMPEPPYLHQTLEDAKPHTPQTKLSPTIADDEDEDQEAGSSGCWPAQTTTPGKGISFFDAWCIPGVIPYSLSYACLKSVNYALFFWLPFYLTVSLDMDNAKAGMYSMLYDAGQIFGGFVGGYVSDKMGVRSPVVVGMLLLSWFTIYNFHGASYKVIGYLIFAAGFMLGGPANLISTAISADLGTHESIKGDAAALSTVTGIVDGTGSIGAAFVQYLVGYLADCHQEPKDCDPSSPNCIQVCSWDPVFILLEGGTILACICLTQLLYHELHLIRSRRHDQ